MATRYRCVCACTTLISHINTSAARQGPPDIVCCATSPRSHRNGAHYVVSRRLRVSLKPCTCSCTLVNFWQVVYTNSKDLRAGCGVQVCAAVRRGLSMVVALVPPRWCHLTLHLHLRFHLPLQRPSLHAWPLCGALSVLHAGGHPRHASGHGNYRLLVFLRVCVLDLCSCQGGLKMKAEF